MPHRCFSSSPSERHADSDGTLMGAPPLIRAISKDPVLSKTKLIAEPWDCGGYQVGSFPNWDIWAEWNGIYRDTVRRFVRGDPGLKAELATRIAGSADLYHTNKRCAVGIKRAAAAACKAVVHAYMHQAHNVQRYGKCLASIRTCLKEQCSAVHVPKAQIAVQESEPQHQLRDRA